MWPSSDDYLRLISCIFVVLVRTDNVCNNNYKHWSNEEEGRSVLEPLCSPRDYVTNGFSQYWSPVLSCSYKHKSHSHRDGGIQLIIVQTTFNGKLMYPQPDTFANPDISMAMNTAVTTYGCTPLWRRRLLRFAIVVHSWCYYSSVRTLGYFRRLQRSFFFSGLPPF
jgi:hypothetical protein